MPFTKDRLRVAIDRYEGEFVDPRISDITRSFKLQVAYHIALILFGVLANLKPSLTSVIGTLGLGSIGFGANFQAAREALEKYQKDRSSLRASVTALRVGIDLCSEDDEACLKDVEALLRKYLEEAMK